MNAEAPGCPPDYHTHTELCKHAQGRPIDYARVAVAKGLPELAASDHGPAPDGFDPEHRMDLAEFDTFRKWVEEAKHHVELPVLFGIEVDYYPGCAEFLSAWLPKQSFDIVLGSIHFLDYWAFDNPAQRTLWESVDVESAWHRYFDLLNQLARSGFYDVVTHLDLPKKFGLRPSDAQLREMCLPVLDRIALARMAIEINTSGLHHPVKEIYPSPIILSWARERGIPIVFGSDAHKPEWVGSDFTEALAAAREAGYVESARFMAREWTLSPLP